MPRLWTTGDAACSVRGTPDVRPATVPAHLRCGPFTLPQAQAAGLTRNALRGKPYVPPPRQVRGRDGLVVLETTLGAEDVWWVGDMLVTSPTRTVFDCLRQLSETEAIVVADALTQLRRTSVEDIAHYIAAQRGVRNCRVAAKRLELVEPKTESPMETRLRLLLLRAGLPRPEPSG